MITDRSQALDQSNVITNGQGQTMRADSGWLPPNPLFRARDNVRNEERERKRICKRLWKEMEENSLGLGVNFTPTNQPNPDDVAEKL